MTLTNPYPDMEAPAFLWRDDVFPSTGFRLECPIAEIDPLVRQFASSSGFAHANDFAWGKQYFQACRVIDGDRVCYVIVRLTGSTWEVLQQDCTFANGIEPHHPRASIAFAACNPKAHRFTLLHIAVACAVAALKKAV